MKIQGLWDENAPLALGAAAENVEALLESVLEMLDISLQYNTEYHVLEDSLYSQMICGEEFVNWLYDYTQPELRDLKKELCIRINKSKPVRGKCMEQQEEWLAREKTFTVGKDGKKTDLVWTCADYWEFKRNVLARCSKAEFAHDLAECFENIYFTDSVEPSLHTLNNQFSDIRGEIVEHLSKLNSYYAEFRSKRQSNVDNRSICLEFKEFSGINCSPQAGRESVHTLYRRFYNVKDKAEEELCCELHTKFKKYNRDRENQDRIYFHPGKDGICEGKIIVIHIGSHQ